MKNVYFGDYYTSVTRSNPFLLMGYSITDVCKFSMLNMAAFALILGAGKIEERLHPESSLDNTDSTI